MFFYVSREFGNSFTGIEVERAVNFFKTKKKQDGKKGVRPFYSVVNARKRI